MRKYNRHVTFIKAAWRYLDMTDSVKRLKSQLESTKPVDEDTAKNIELKLKWIENYLQKTTEQDSVHNIELLVDRLPSFSTIGEIVGLGQVFLEDGTLTNDNITYVIKKLYRYDARPICDLLQNKYSFTYRAIGIKIKRIKWISKIEETNSAVKLVIDMPWIMGYIQNHTHSISLHKDMNNEDTFLLPNQIPYEVVSHFLE
jgi:hypothetical protein